MTRTAGLPKAVADAVEWMALQRSGAMSDTDRKHFQQWLHANPLNQQAWAGLEQRIGQAFNDLPALSCQVLSESGNKRRRLLRGALAVACVGVGGVWLQRSGLLTGSGDDLYTGVAQRRRFTLEDGSRVLLNAHSRAGLSFDNQQRTLTLHEGALSIQVASDPRRPLVVRTSYGEVRALGTRFSVNMTRRDAQIWVQESRVQINVPGYPPLTVGAGQGAAIDQHGIHTLDSRQSGANAWENGQLVVHDQSLGDVVEALRAYHHGWLRISPPAAALRVTGAFSLDDSAQALRTLQEVLPIRVEQHLAWWTHVSLR